MQSKPLDFSIGHYDCSKHPNMVFRIYNQAYIHFIPILFEVLGQYSYAPRNRAIQHLPRVKYAE